MRIASDMILLCHCRPLKHVSSATFCRNGEGIYLIRVTGDDIVSGHISIKRLQRETDGVIKRLLKGATHKISSVGLERKQL